jgi:hypothetical protein
METVINIYIYIFFSLVTNKQMRLKDNTLHYYKDQLVNAD